MPNISSWIEAHARFKPEKLAIVDQQQDYTYAQLAAAIATNARVLKHQLRVGRGDRVAYLGLNGIEFISLLFACARLGAIFVPLNWRLETPEYDYILADASPKVLIVTNDFKLQVETLNDAHLDCCFVMQNSSDHHQSWKCLFTLQQATAKSEDSYNAQVDLHAPLLIVYTSGTTGHPKGAVLTQQALFYNALNSQHMHDMSSSDTILTVLPMFHVGGLNIQTLPALYVGATVILHPRFDPQQTLATIQHQKPSLTVLVPATLSAIVSLPQWNTTDLSSLRSITSGSSIVPPSLIDTVMKRGLPVQQVYGLTETSPIAVYQTLDQATTKSHST
ncbi:MAG: AMP-binding protein, partial [Oceanospirillaceae bacterium]|nr:AMP-binding protein [Oceanospirillaceae bacterium]